MQDEESVTSDDGDGAFEADKNEVDDETTMITEERLGRDMTYEEELDILNRENEMSVEELRAMYTGMNDTDKQESDVEDDSKEVAIKKEVAKTETTKAKLVAVSTFMRDIMPKNAKIKTNQTTFASGENKKVYAK